MEQMITYITSYESIKCTLSSLKRLNGSLYVFVNAVKRNASGKLTAKYSLDGESKTLRT